MQPCVILEKVPDLDAAYVQPSTGSSASEKKSVRKSGYSPATPSVSRSVTATEFTSNPIRIIDS